MIVDLGEVPVNGLGAWVEGIPLAEWPQQDRLIADSPYPAMVRDLSWHGFGKKVEPMVVGLIGQWPDGYADKYTLSMVVPGQSVVWHVDKQGPFWITRVHVPLCTNERATMSSEEQILHLRKGHAYSVDTRLPHSIVNNGDGPRIHFFFDVRSR